jgi:hypothetical protein
VGENRRNRRKFTDEFKRDAVALVDSSGKPIAQIAKDRASRRPPWATGSARTASTAANNKG